MAGGIKKTIKDTYKKMYPLKGAGDEAKKALDQKNKQTKKGPVKK